MSTPRSGGAIFGHYSGKEAARSRQSPTVRGGLDNRLDDFAEDVVAFECQSINKILKPDDVTEHLECLRIHAP